MIVFVQVWWGIRDQFPGDKKFRPDTHSRFFAIEADSPLEGELIACQMMEGREGPDPKRTPTNVWPMNPIADMPHGMISRSRQL